MEGILESLLFAAGDKGLSLKQIGSALQVSKQEAKELVNDLEHHYENDLTRGITITLLAGTYQLVTKKEHAEYIQKLVEASGPGPTTLTQAGLETMAIIAYKQPITRVEIEDIRGVSTEQSLRTLMAKDLIKQVGRREGIGRAILYGTTKEFLDYFGLKDINELPPLPEKADDATIDVVTDLFSTSFQERTNSQAKK